MNDLEKELLVLGRELDKLEAPPQLESRLRNALKERVKPKPRYGLIAAILIGFIFFSYNFDVIAYYGKTILGYEEVVEGPIKELIEDNQGQEINKSYQFKNGIIFTLDGIMLDDNRLITFYTLDYGTKNLKDYSLSSLDMKGVLRYYGEGGYGKFNETFTQVKWVYDFEPPKFFERNLTLNFILNGPEDYREEGSITFKIDRSKAMATAVRQKINQSIKVNDTTVKFHTITATPTQTVIKGAIGTPLEHLNNLRKNQNFRYNIQFDLLADGEIINWQGGGLRTSPQGISFEGRFDPLPTQLNTLAIKLTGLTISEPVDILVDLQMDGEQEETITIAGNKIILERLYTENDNTYLTIRTEDDILLEKVYLLIDDKEIPLERTIPGEHQKHGDGRLTYQRTLEFKEKGNKVSLIVKRISYQKGYEELISIPIMD